MIQDRREAPLQLPRGEEERPVDELRDLREIHFLQITAAEERRRGDDVLVPVVLQPVRARLLDGEERLLLAPGVLLRACSPASRGSARSNSPALVAEQAGDDVHRTRRVVHVDDGPAVLVRDLHRGVLRTGRGAADEQRHA